MGAFIKKVYIKEFIREDLKQRVSAWDLVELKVLNLKYESKGMSKGMQSRWFIIRKVWRHIWILRLVSNVFQQRRWMASSQVLDHLCMSVLIPATANPSCCSPLKFFFIPVTANPSCCSPLKFFFSLYISFQVGVPDCTAILNMWPHQCFISSYLCTFTTTMHCSS